MRCQIDRFQEEVESDLLESSLVELDWAELWLLKIDAKLSISLSKFDYPNYLYYRLMDVCVNVGGHKATLFNYSQVEEVVCVKHQHLGGDENRFGCLFHHDVLLQISD